MKSLTAEEIKLRGSLLSTNRGLLELHRTLVRGGLLSEEEFWETRQPLLRSQQTLLNQKKPSVSSNGGLGPAGGPTTGADHKIVLTPETINTILTGHPALVRAHREFVPHQMSEKEFWTWYVRSRFFATSKELLEARDSDENPLNAYYEEEQNDERERERSTNALEATQPEISISRLVDVAATTEDHPDDNGLAMRTMQLLRTQAGEETLSLIRKFNNNSLRALQTTATGMRASSLPVSIEEATELEDLRATRGPMTIVLELKDTTNDSKGRAGSTDEGRKITLEQIKSFIGEAMSRKSLNALSTLQKSMLDAAELVTLSSSAQWSSDNAVSGLSSTFSVSFLTERGGEILQFHANAAEILRHYWAATLPPPMEREPERNAKATRMLDLLEQFLRRGQELIRARATLEQQAVVESALCPILECIEWALQRGNGRTDRRST